jgi:hypothetical protein
MKEVSKLPKVGGVRASDCQVKWTVFRLYIIKTAVVAKLNYFLRVVDQSAV